MVEGEDGILLGDGLVEVGVLMEELLGEEIEEMEVVLVLVSLSFFEI